ncbi:hypothetical protein UPYG_G00274910 [Umbra pygmaea]|uniref:RING-type domain-containing protein n=1 Tax=Umbra pygmaea TaxID=75934 RepID=A0ABD0W227_UMBPY
MTATPSARYHPTWDLALDPLMSCKLEYAATGRLQFEREVLLDPCRTWCPSSSCQAVCQLTEGEMPQLVQCPVCSLEFCSGCRSTWHNGQSCQDNMPVTTLLPGETSSYYKSDEEDDAPSSAVQSVRCTLREMRAVPR